MAKKPVVYTVIERNQPSPEALAEFNKIRQEIAYRVATKEVIVKTQSAK